MMRFLTRTFIVKLRKCFLLCAFLATSIFTITYVHRRPVNLSNRILKTIVDFEDHEEIPKAPGAFMKKLKPSNFSFCNFGYGLPESFAYSEEDFEYGPELGREGGYKVLYNVVAASSNRSEVCKHNFVICGSRKVVL